jgi:ABC-type sugar transport system ATPase subunit
MSQAVPLLEIHSVTKDFPGVRALDNVSLEVNRGELMALLGENGAGKSTLVKILSGALTRDAGTIRVDGRELPKSLSPVDARRLGIAIIYQELSLLPHLSVAENIYLGRQPLKSRLLRVIDYARMNRAAQQKLAELRADHILPTAPIHTLSLPEKQMVEIAKALAVNCRVVIMDEPTTTLTSEETQRLFDVIKALKQQNVTIIYISHRLDEVFQIADRATVLRDGKVVGTVATKDTSKAHIISMMTGKRLQERERIPHAAVSNHKAELLRVEHVGDGILLQDISFSVYENEVLGIAGLVGAGRTELARMLFGADRKATGRLFLSGKEVRVSSPKEALHKGLGYLSENRKEEGLNLGMKLEDNIMLTDFSAVSRVGVINSRSMREMAASFITRLDIRGKPETVANTLSGGNQQKVAISKWLHVGCKVIIFDEPTRGIDVVAKTEILSLIRDFASDGRGAIVISSEVDDLLDVCDRILIMAKGQITQVLEQDEISKDLVLECVTRGY